MPYTVAAVLLVLACGDGNGADGGKENGGAEGSPGGISDDPLGNRSRIVSSHPFRFGINHGHRNPGFSDTDQSVLSRDAGATSARIKLPEYHLKRWGLDIELGDMESYVAHGKHDLVAFVLGMTEEHSTAPAGTPDWKRDYYIPDNLHEPIWLDDGTVNPDNYWAAYLYDTMKTYGQYVTYWEIWNEPDWVSDWQVTQEWEDEPPRADDLPRFNGSIFDYVRMLRIATEVRDQVAPQTQVGLGGIGYATFLDAIMRYTDEPDSGAVDDEHPRTGAAYFDALIFHHYPHFTPGNSDAAVAAFVEHRDRLAQRLDDHGVGPVSWVVTETGASHREMADIPSGPLYARNYLMKVMTRSAAEGLSAVHWFILSDGDAESEDPYASMGLYEDVALLSARDDAVLTTNGIAYQTMSDLLSGARHTEQVTETLAFGDGVAAYGFVFDDDRRAIVAWAVSDQNEKATAAVEWALEGTFHAYSWEASQGAEPLELGLGDELALSSTPQIVIEQ